jgi:hypothetical protein
VSGDLDRVMLGIRKRLQRARDIEVELLTAPCGTAVGRPGVQRVREWNAPVSGSKMLRAPPLRGGP